MKNIIIGFMITMFLMFYVTVVNAVDIPEGGFNVIPVKEINRYDEYRYSGDIERIYKWGECTLNGDFTVRIKNGISYQVYNVFVKAPCGKNWTYNVLVTASVDSSTDIKMHDGTNPISNRFSEYKYDNYDVFLFYNYYCSDGTNKSDNIDLYYLLPNDGMIIGGNSIDSKLLADKIYDFVNGIQVEDIKTSDDVVFDNDGSIVEKSKIVYDLEIPLNVNVDVSGKKTTITWEQSDDIDVQGWETEIYVNQTGYTKKQYWSKKVKYDSNWLFADEVLNYKNKYSYKGIMMPVVEDYLKNKLGYDPHVREVQKSNFMIRNKYYDEVTGLLHYSNFVKFDQDGNAYVYYATEVSSEKVQDLIGKGEDITSDALDEATDTNSEYYNGEQTSSFNQATNVDITDFFSGFSNVIGNIPDLFNKIFSFLPDECLLFVALGISVVVLLRILGR